MEGRKNVVDAESPVDLEDGETALPVDVIFQEVLPWLPVKSLVQFMCVSKSWCSFLKTPEFASTHLSRLNKNIIFSDAGHQKLLLLSCCYYPLRSCETLDYEEEKSVPIACDFPLGDGVIALCSCNGMVCLAIINSESLDISGLVLWNPSTGDYKKIKSLPGMQIIRRGWGFYYDEAVNDYKILHFNIEGEAHMYSLKSDSWRTIKGVDGARFNFSSAAVLFDGYLFWTGRTNDNFNEVLLSFDLNNEKFATMPLPKIANYRYYFTRLATHQERLHLFISYHDGNGMEIEMWRMNVNKKGVWESITTLILTNFFETICFTSNGKVLLYQAGTDGRREIVLYDHINHMIERGFLIDEGNTPIKQWKTYDQTLVSPNGIG